MSGKSVSAKGVVAAGAATIAAFTVIGCGGGGGYVARHRPAPDGAATHGHPVKSPAGMNQAQAKAKAEVENCVHKAGATGMLSSAGRTVVIDCIKSLVPPDKQKALKACLTHAVAHDRVYTSSGRETFTSKDAPACVTAAS